MDTSTGYYLGVRFPSSEKSYYFSCPNNDFAIGDLVIVMTSSGVEAGVVTIAPAPLSTYTAPLELKAILRKADKRDLEDYQRNLEDAKRVLAITKEEVEALGLQMDLVNAYFTIDGSKVTITYTSEKRVDFRELLKVLSPQIGCRIELHQIASRDKAKMIGGLGICGLPLCCSTFLNQFEGISIQRAKNQMLTLNIPKLSGPCGKLICCLTFEDDMYTEAKKEFPRFGTVVKLDEGPYTVDGINILSRTVRLVNSNRSDYKTFPLEDVLAMLNGTYQRRAETPRQEEVALPSFGIETPRSEERPLQNRGNDRNQQQSQDRNRNNRHGRHHNGNQQNNDQQRQNQNNNQPRQNQGNNNPQQNQDGQQRRNSRHRHHRHGHGNRGGNNGGGNAQ